MNAEERILAALDHREPDRVPVMGLLVDPTTANKVLRKKPVRLVKYLKKPVIKDLIRAFMNATGTWNAFYRSNTAACLESAARLGFDANWAIYTRMTLVKDPSTEVGMAWHDLQGRAWEIGEDEIGNIVPRYTKGLLPDEQAWNHWMSAHEDDFNTYIESVAQFHARLTRDFRHRLLPINYIGSGPYENSWQPMGFTSFAKYTRTKPEFIRQVINFYVDFAIKCFGAICKPGIKVVMGGDDLGHKTGPLMQPKAFDALFGEGYKRISDFVHSKGCKLLWHSCGNIYEYLDYFIDWGFDGIVSLEPTAGMDLARVRKLVGHKLVLVGNLDVSELLVSGTKAEIEHAVKVAIGSTAAGGGYILAATHSHPKVDPTRLQWMVDAARNHGNYPLGDGP